MLSDLEPGPVAAAEATAFGEPLVVFWDGRLQGAMAFRPEAGGTPLSFGVERDRIVDAETGSTWRLDGTAVDGPLAGTRLEPVEDAYVAFWFAWAAFHPEGEIWGPESGR